MRRVVSTLVALLAVGCTALSSAAALKMPATDEKIILTTASGEEKIVTRAEMEAIENQQRQLHAQLLDRVEGEWVEDESLSDVARRDPLLARSIVIARDSFDVLQQHGYARGYTLSSFTEVDEIPITSQRAQKDPDFNGRIELRITLQLRATLDPQSGVQANSGTSAAKRGAAPQTLGYEVEVLFDKHEVASVVYAWQLTADDRRGKELRIAPSEALKKRYEERQRANGGFRYATWLLAGGVMLVMAGGAVLMLTPRAPPPAKKAEPAPTSPTKARDARKRKDAKSVLEREAGDKWELANGR